MKFIKIIFISAICLGVQTGIAMYEEAEESVFAAIQNNKSPELLSTKLIEAIQKGDLKKIVSLIKKNANPFIASQEGIIPYDYAQLYTQQGALSQTKDQIITYFKSNFPEYETYEIVIDAEDDEGW